MVDAITAEDLKELQDGDESYLLVDTRRKDSFEAWHIRDAVNFPFGLDAEMTDDRLDEFRHLADGDPVVTVCAKGVTSDHFAEALESATDEFGEVSVVDGGMQAWSRVYDVARVDVGSDRVEVLQVQRRPKGCLGYVVADAETGEAAVVDATRDTAAFREATEDAGYEVTRVFDTHVHADHISGGRKLAEEVGATYHLGAAAEARDVTYEFEPLDRNEVVTVGSVELKAVYAPGHTSETVNYLVDADAMLTADTLHVNSTGRTELEFGEGRGEEGARTLYETLHRTILAEPDAVTVLPGHVTVTPDGEFADGRPGAPVTTTIGDARTGIDELRADEEAFVAHHEDPGEKPPNYETIIDINRGAADVPDDQDAVELEMGPNNCSA